MKIYYSLILVVILVLSGCSHTPAPIAEQPIPSPTKLETAAVTPSPTAIRPTMTAASQPTEDLPPALTPTPTLLPYTPEPTPEPPVLSRLQIINRTNVNQLKLVWRYEPPDNRPETWGGAFAFSPDGKTVALSVGDHVERVDLEQGKTVQTYSLDHRLPHWATEKVYSLAFSPGGKRLAGLTEAGVVLWDVSSEKPLWVTKMEEGSNEAFTKMIFSPGGDVIVTTSIAYGSDIRVWSTETGEQVRALHRPNQLDAIFNLDGTRLFTVDRLEGFIWAWDTVTWEAVNFSETTGAYATLTLSPNGKMVAVNSGWNGDGEDTTTLYLLDGWKCLGSLLTRFDGFILGGTPVYSTLGPTRIEPSFNRDGGILALAIATNNLGSRPDHMELWDTASLKLIASLDETFPTPITWGAFSPDGRLLAARSDNGTIIFWGVPAQ